MSLTLSASLVLGTVQLGLSYGIANKTGRPDQSVVTDIVRTAWEKGVREFDTAQDYGMSEQALGAAFVQLGISKEAKLISKINPELDHGDPSIMKKALGESFEKLRVRCLWGLMLHKEELLCRWSKGLGDILKSFVALGKVEHLGVSVYSPDKALEALHTEGIDMIQVPSNILDRRFEKQGVFELAAKKEKQVYIRSVFLQGLILMDPENLSARMAFARQALRKVKSLSQELNLTRQELAIGYLKLRAPQAKLVIGAETPQQVVENVASWEKNPPEALMPLVLRNFDQLDEKLLNPSLWSR
jgi:aryl-alcohol dehydrogenase-like predicted oxidoreductase